MADDAFLAPPHTLIAGRFAVDTSQILLDAGGGIPAYLARDRMLADDKRIALAASREASPRADALRTLTEPIDNLMVPIGHGVAPMAGGKGEGYFIICTPPPGSPVSTSLHAWPESVLIDLVLRPIARVLEILQSRKLTHRAIRPNNVFQSAPGQQVTLGAAWAAPPGMHQPVVFECPYSAMCHPTGRGAGTISDDVYALGVLLLTLLAGRVPMANMDDATIIRWKLDLGSFPALTRDIQVSGAFADLLRAMLAEDPEHRSSPSQLLDPAALRGRRVAARPARRSQNPLMLNGIAVFDARMLAFALLSEQKKSLEFLRNGLITQWLRRGLADAALAAQVEDLVRGRLTESKAGLRNDPLLLMHTISAINPRMPLCWRGVALFPDALPSILAEGTGGRSDMLTTAEELLVNEIAGSWSPADQRQGRTDRPDISGHRLPGGGQAGLLRLFYGLNPLLPCRVPAMAARWIADIPSLMRFLERVASDKATANVGNGDVGDSLIDLHIAAFIAAHADRKVEMQVHRLLASKDSAARRIGELVLLQVLQTRYHPAPLPSLAKWMAARLRPDLERWQNKPHRQAMQARLDVLAQAGVMSRLLDLTEDAVGQALDSAGSIRAAGEMAAIDAEVATIDNNDKLRFADAERFGHAIAGGIGLSAFILMAMSVLLR
jgi:eukaryotic-like serine/threonine-protein kinase